MQITAGCDAIGDRAEKRIEPRNAAKEDRVTVFAFSLCKKALEANENNVSKAEQWLQREAAKHGWEKGVKLQGRRAEQGLIGVHVDREQRNGFLVEVNCESDFVGRNEQFKQLVVNVLQTIATAPQTQYTVRDAAVDNSHNSSSVTKYSIEAKDLEVFKDRVNAAIAKLGENIKISRASIMKSNDTNTKLVGYTHAIAGQTADIDGILLGKYGTIVAFKQVAQDQTASDQQEFGKYMSVNRPREENRKSDGGDASAEVGEEEEEIISAKNEEEIVKLPIEQVSKIICQHIIGVKPKVVTLSKEQLVKENNELENANASSDARESILEESDALLCQRMLINENVTVKDFLNFQNVDVVDFIRYECGENID
ncbi:elongation factor Ts: mitochondrial-like protein [Dinothrombium tinctorium]|uniref:Elongation factor Ts, mitochondrial n=1 Tax=Dinothrombium tinctorium TaxID=1965070 RepID=A0A443RM93_9ACAR|nr:elongation factor Ts: mitochondrial-like protein [Dinothrombium tinctorium]